MEQAQVEDEIKMLLNTLTGANVALLSFSNGKTEELDASRQRLIKEVSALRRQPRPPAKQSRVPEFGSCRISFVLKTLCLSHQTAFFGQFSGKAYAFAVR